jgi:hypothetical protein
MFINALMSLALLFFSFTYSAQAAESGFEKVGQMFFEQSVGITRAQAKGWWSGRCFAWDSKSKPRPAALLGVEVTEDAGPGLPNTSRFYMSIVLAEDLFPFEPSRPERFDTLTTPDAHALEQYIARDFNRSLLGETKVTEERLAQRMNLPREVLKEGWDAGYMVFARSGEYIVNNSRLLHHAGGEHSPGLQFDWFRCYFFKKIKE